MVTQCIYFTAIYENYQHIELICWIYLGYKKVWILLTIDTWFTGVNPFTILNFVLFFARYMYLLCVALIALRFNVCFCKKIRKCFWEKKLINNRKSLGESKVVNIHSFTPPHKLPRKLEKQKNSTKWESLWEKGKSNLGFWFQISKMIIVRDTPKVNSKKLKTFRKYSNKDNSRCDQVI